MLSTSRASPQCTGDAVCFRLPTVDCGLWTHAFRLPGPARRFHPASDCVSSRRGRWRRICSHRRSRPGWRCTACAGRWRRRKAPGWPGSKHFRSSEWSRSRQRNFCVVSGAPCLRTSSSVCSEKASASFSRNGLGRLVMASQRGDAAGIKPFEQLSDAINRFVPAFELRLQFVAGQGFDVSRHG